MTEAGAARRRLVLGALALVFWAIHNSTHLLHHRPLELLWGCNVAAVLVGAGLVAGWAAVSGVGTLWLAFGLPVWVWDTSTGGELIQTSFLVHVGVTAIGVAGVRLVGLPRGTWWKALVAMLSLHLLSRAVTPPAANINLAFAVWPGFDRYFRSHVAYAVFVHASAGAYFYAVERLLRRTLVAGA